MTTVTQKIPSGYKQTEIGLIPIDWDLMNIEDLTPLGKKYGIVDGPFGSNLKTEHYRKSGIPIITSGYVTDGRFIVDKYLYVDKEKFIQEKRSAVRGGDIVMAKIGARCGASAILPKNHMESILSGNALKITVDENRFSTFFVWQILWNLYIEGNLESLRTTGAQPAISMANLKKYKILIPSNKSEQIAIATALSDVDVLINKLEKCIEKKKNIKLGVMQGLLTGKRRLSGFSKEWETKLLPDITWFQEGPGVRTSQFTQSGVKLLNGTNIYKGKLLLDNTNRFISESEAFGPYSHFLVDDGDIVIASSGIIVDKFEEKISFVKKEHLPLCMNTSTIRFKIRNNLLDPLFLYYFFMSKKFKDQIGAQATGSAQLNFGPSHLEKVEIALPKDKKEQAAITEIISSMDAEIEKLESQLTKYQNIKQGMMQTLLTGKIRLLTK